jgi:hypothetical protein
MIRLIPLIVSLLFISNIKAEDLSKLDNITLIESIEYFVESLNRSFPIRQNQIVSIQEAMPKDEDTLVIVKVLQPIENDPNSAILVDTIVNNISQDDDFSDDFIDSELNRYCNNKMAQYIFARGGYIRVILKSMSDQEILYFDMAKKSCLN